VGSVVVIAVVVISIAFYPSSLSSSSSSSSYPAYGGIWLLFGHHVTFTFTFRAFGRRFYPKRLAKSTSVEGDSNISLWYIKIKQS